MLRPLSDLPPRVIGFEAVGEVHADDYRDVLRPALDQAAVAGEIRFVYVIGPEFTGYSAGAGWEDAKLAFQHVRSWERTAVVTDVDWIDHAVRTFGWMAPGEVKVFALDERADALRWVADLGPAFAGVVGHHDEVVPVDPHGVAEADDVAPAGSPPVGPAAEGHDEGGPDQGRPEDVVDGAGPAGADGGGEPEPTGSSGHDGVPTGGDEGASLTGGEPAPADTSPWDRAALPERTGPTPPTPVVVGGADETVVVPGLGALDDDTDQHAAQPAAAEARPAHDPAPEVPEQWAPDPSGRHQYRWWNGREWTEHVADDGRNGIDPVR